VVLSDKILKGTHPGIIYARFDLIWFRGFRGEDLNVVFYQNMSNLHNRYKSAIPGFSVNFFFQPIYNIPIMQIRHILIKDHI
jgi:hypothetical protein